MITFPQVDWIAIIKTWSDRETQKVLRQNKILLRFVPFLPILPSKGHNFIIYHVIIVWFFHPKSPHRIVIWLHHGCCQWRIWSKASKKSPRPFTQILDFSCPPCQLSIFLWVSFRTLLRSPMSPRRASEPIWEGLSQKSRQNCLNAIVSF